MGHAQALRVPIRKCCCGGCVPLFGVRQLVANLPGDVAVQVQVGRRFLDAGDPRGALDHFVRALRMDPDNGGTLAGAGESVARPCAASRA